jgi:hypothetical protein
MTNLLDEEPELPQQTDPNVDYFAELVGPGKKFQDEKALAKGKYESDSYIKLLEKRLDESRQDYLRVREENVARARLEELIDQLKTGQQPPSSESPLSERSQEKPRIDPTEIEALLDKKFSEFDKKKRDEENLNLVKSKLKEQYGSRYQDVLKNQIEELGLSEDDMAALARKSPTAFFKTVGLDSSRPPENFQTPPRSEQISTSFKPRTEKRTWNWYQNLKKQDPKTYHSREITLQMHKDAQELGEAFKDGDFNAI